MDANFQSSGTWIQKAEASTFFFTIGKESHELGNMMASYTLQIDYESIQLMVKKTLILTGVHDSDSSHFYFMDATACGTGSWMASCRGNDQRLSNFFLKFFYYHSPFNVHAWSLPYAECGPKYSLDSQYFYLIHIIQGVC